MQSEKINYTQIIIDQLSVLHQAEKAAKNTFKARAYSTVITNLQVANKPIYSIDDIKGIKGIGEKIKAKIEEILATGELQRAKQISQSVSNKTFSQLSKVYGIGPAKIDACIKLGIYSIVDLKEYDKNHPDFLTTNQKIGLKYVDDFTERIPREEMDLHNEIIHKIIKKVNKDINVELVGSYRRGQSSSGDIDVLIWSNFDINLAEIVEEMQNQKYISDVLALGDKKCLGVCCNGKKSRRIDLLLTPKEEVPFALAYFTGSQEFNIKMRAKALEMGYSLNEHGLTLVNQVHVPTAQEKARLSNQVARPNRSSETHKPERQICSEEDLFSFLKMDWVDPTKR